ncbi:pilus assembly protein PilM [Candidatus Saccharibacteria bacterium]|nr:pilus assembly protein PilM [Candidatus Saccharibacteria bacterium]
MRNKIVERLSKLKPTKGEAVLALDIGTEFVKVLAAKLDDRIEILGANKVRQEAGAMHDGAIADIRAVTVACEKAISELERQIGQPLRKTVVGVAGELVKASATTITYRRKNHETPIAEDEMHSILQKVENRALENTEKQINRETNRDTKIRLINSALVGMDIDGYKVTNPIGFPGKEIAVQIYTAFAPLVHIGPMEAVCRELDLDLLAIATEPFAVFRAVVGDQTASNITTIILDIGGGTTDVAVVSNGGVEGTKSFAIGGRSFTRQIADSMDLDMAAAEKCKLALGSDALSDATRERILAAVQPSLTIWQAGVGMSLEEFGGLDHLPSKILLCGGGASLDQITEVLKSDSFLEDLPFAKTPEVKLIDPSALPGIKNRGIEEIDHSFITAIGLLWVAKDSLSS